MKPWCAALPCCAAIGGGPLMPGLACHRAFKRLTCLLQSPPRLDRPLPPPTLVVRLPSVLCHNPGALPSVLCHSPGAPRSSPTPSALVSRSSTLQGPRNSALRSPLPAPASLLAARPPARPLWREPHPAPLILFRTTCSGASWRKP